MKPRPSFDRKNGAVPAFSVDDLRPGYLPETILPSPDRGGLMNHCWNSNKNIDPVDIVVDYLGILN
jgi:hypothetical protein